MPARLPTARHWLAALLALTPLQLSAQDLPRDPPAEGDLALMGTIPIYWGERGDLADLLSTSAAPHWARAEIERHYRLRPLDYLSAEALAGHRRLLLAQPRGLSAEENVALDAWVRGGGQVLLFADPMLTAHSAYGLGDRRRPQDVALLSPILAHWGLELRFDEGQAEGRQMRDLVPPALPVDLAGELVLRGPDASCIVFGEGIAADCRLGEGAALVIADAAVLDGEVCDEAARAALSGLISRIFGNLVPPSAPLAEDDINQLE